MTYDPWASPTGQPATGWQAPPTAVVPTRPSTRRRDVITFGVIVVGLVLVAAPVGLLWSAVAPHYSVTFVNGEASYPDIESTKAFIGADGSYAAVILAAGVLSGLAAWFFARRSGPWTVVALAVGGIFAALIVARVGLLPGREESFQAIEAKKGTVELFLGTREGDGTHLRAGWAAVAWPVGALLAFAVPAFIRPEELD